MYAHAETLDNRDIATVASVCPGTYLALVPFLEHFFLLFPLRIETVSFFFSKIYCHVQSVRLLLDHIFFAFSIFTRWRQSRLEPEVLVSASVETPLCRVEALGEGASELLTILRSSDGARAIFKGSHPGALDSPSSGVKKTIFKCTCHRRRSRREAP